MSDEFDEESDSFMSEDEGFLEEVASDFSDEEEYEFPTTPSYNETIYAPQPSFVPQITVPQSPPPITFETVGRNFIVRSNPGVLAPYRTYLENLYGKYNEETNTWTFYQKREAEVRDLLQRIVSGQLPPPDQLPAAQQFAVDIQAAGELPIRPSTTVAQVIAEAPPPPEPISRRRAAPAPVPPPAPPTYLPSQVIQATMPASIVPPMAPPTAQPQLPPYNPTTKDPSESQAEYDRRMQLYRHLMGLGVASETADLLSRMRNQVDIHGVTYDPSAMLILNTYLPLAQ